KNEIEKEGLPGDITPALGAEGLRFKSGRSFPPNPARPQLYPSALGNANIVLCNIVVATIIVVTHLTQVGDGNYKHTGRHHPGRPVREGLNHLPPGTHRMCVAERGKLCHYDPSSRLFKRSPPSRAP